MNSIGIILYYRGELNMALDYYQRSLALYEDIGDKQGIALSLNNIAESYRHKGEPDRSLDHYERSMAIFEKIGNKRGIVHSGCGLAKMNLDLGKTQEALEDALKAVEISSEIQAKSEESMSRRTLGTVYRENKEWDMAAQEFEKARTILEDVGDKRELSKTIYEHALLFKATDEPTKAQEQLEQEHKELQE